MSSREDISIKDDFMHPDLRESFEELKLLMGEPKFRNHSFGKAHLSSPFGMSEISISHPPDIEYYGSKVYEAINMSRSGFAQVQDVRFEDHTPDSLDALLLKKCPWFHQVAEFNAQTEPKVYVEPEMKAVPDLRCPAATVENSWIHCVIDEIHSYLIENPEHIIYFYDCVDAFDIAREKLGEFKHNLKLTAPGIRTKATIHYVVFSYWDQYAIDWLEKAENWVALTWSFAQGKGGGNSSLVQWDKNEARWFDPSNRRKYRPFRLFAAEELRKITDSKQFTYKNWTTIRAHIPKYRATSSMDDAAKAFSVCMSRKPDYGAVSFIRFYNAGEFREGKSLGFATGTVSAFDRWKGFKQGAAPPGFESTGNAHLVRYTVQACGQGQYSVVFRTAEGLKMSYVTKLNCQPLVAKGYGRLYTAINHGEMYDDAAPRISRRFELFTCHFFTCGNVCYVPGSSRPRSLLKMCSVLGWEIGIPTVDYNNTWCVPDNMDCLYSVPRNEASTACERSPICIQSHSEVTVVGYDTRPVSIGDYTEEGLKLWKMFVGDYAACF